MHPLGQQGQRCGNTCLNLGVEEYCDDRILEGRHGHASVLVRVCTGMRGRNILTNTAKEGAT